LREAHLLIAGGCACLFIALWNIHSRQQQPTIDFFVPHSLTSPTTLPVVGIIFQPQDCTSLIDALSFWNGPHLAQEVHVVGLLRGTSRNEKSLHKIVNGAGLEFPIRIVGNRSVREVRSALGYSDGSLIIVFDAEGRVRMVTRLSELSSRAQRDRILSFALTLQPRRSNHAE